jgi:hypothetical protein
LNTIRLHPDLTAEQIAVLTEYLRGQHNLTHDQWGQLREAVDLLGQSTIELPTGAITLKTFYEEFIDRQFADSFLQALTAADGEEREAKRLQAETARRIGQWIRGQAFEGEGRLERRLLLTFCLYWWAAFATGYAFEVAIIHDLRVAGVTFACHDITKRAERLSPFDLTVLGLRGDIKYGTYFLAGEDVRAEEIDFFITRLYDEPGARWLQVVFLRPAGWVVIDGDTMPAAWKDVASVLPAAVSLDVASTTFVLILYEDWKRRILLRLTREGAEADGKEDNS